MLSRNGDRCDSIGSEAEDDALRGFADDDSWGCWNRSYGWADTTLCCLQLLNCCDQGCWMRLLSGIRHCSHSEFHALVANRR